MRVAAASMSMFPFKAVFQFLRNVGSTLCKGYREKKEDRQGQREKKEKEEEGGIRYRANRKSRRNMARATV